MLTSFFNRLDIFKFPITFMFSDSNRVSTNSGKIITLLIIIYIIYAFVTSDMISKTNPNAILQDINTESRPSLYLSKSNFTFGIGLTDSNNFYYQDETIFSFDAIMDSYDFVTNEYFPKNFSLIHCENNSFIDSPAPFNSFNNSGLYCLPDDLYHLVGSFAESYVSYMSIGFTSCLNSSSNNFSCKSPEEIELFFQNKILSFFITENLVDANDYPSPLKPRVKNHYYIIDSKIKKSVQMEIKKIEVIDKVGFFFEKEEKKISFTSVKTDSDFNSQDLDINNPYAKIFSLEFYSHDKILQAKRKYQTIQDLVAQIGGILNVLIIIGFIIVRIEYSFLFTKFVSGELYSFQKLDKKKKKTMEKENNLGKESASLKNQYNEDKEIIFSQELHFKDETSKPDENLEMKFKKIEATLVKKNIEISPKLEMKDLQEDEMKISCSEIERENIENSSKNKISSPNSPLKKSFTRLKTILSRKPRKTMQNLDIFVNAKNVNSNFPLAICNYFKLLIKGKKLNLSEEEKLYLKSENQIRDEFDIIEILKKMQEIEKLKRILLNEKQLFLFNVLSKPMITLDNKDNNNLKTKLDESEYLAQKEKIFDKSKLKEIYNDIKQSHEKTEIDNRIIALLDKDVLTVIQHENDKNIFEHITK